MEDSSVKESEVENRGTSGTNEPVGLPRASSAGFSPKSEVHIVSFHGCFFHWSTSIPVSIFHFCALALGPF